MSNVFCNTSPHNVKNYKVNVICITVEHVMHNNAGRLPGWDCHAFEYGIYKKKKKIKKRKGKLHTGPRGGKYVICLDGSSLQFRTYNH
jgi:hypothetical protein